MQDIHSIEETSGGGGRLFAGAGNRQLRPHHHPHHHQDLKCPRCDSSNTKFCYYNNYNLSQPRHFCKSCRRYWTNGGVLRNVPVGGGVRKAKRSAGKPKSKTTAVSTSSAATAATAASDPPDLDRRSTTSETSSSDSCSRTATATPITTAEASRSNSTNSTPPPMLRDFNEPSTKFFNIPHSSSSIATVDPVVLSQSYGGNRSSEMRTFAGLMRSMTDDHELPLGIEKSENEIQRDVKMAENWEENGDHEGLFDQSYWSESLSQWNDVDDDDHHHHRLNYLP